VDKDFRHDINALRAVAVVAVLLFHFGVPGFAGGFVGVDVFFVISGFLMASIIITRLQHQTFSLGHFYLARARRIVPALAVLVASLLLIGWWLLPPMDYRDLAANSGYALVFIANIRFQRDAGYFDAAAHDNWLLHTWSLAVEGQFYLLLPLVLILLWRLKLTKYLLPMLIVLLLASLARSTWLTQTSPDAGFFLLQSRAWQLLTGAAVFVLSQHAIARKLRQFAEIATTTGLLLILATVLSVNANTAWPGVTAIAPVVGTAMILLTAHQAAWMRSAPVQMLGLSSYSLYLWHWPVVVALIYLGIADNVLAIMAGMALSVILGLLSWQLIEIPSRQTLKSASVIVVIGAVTLTPAVLIYLQNGIAGRLPPDAERAAAEAQNYDPRRDECLANNGVEFPWCQYGGPDTQAIVVGDSHASSLFTAFAAAVQDDEHGYGVSIVDNSGTVNNQGILASSYNGCPTLLQGTSVDNSAGCRAFNDYLVAQMQTLPDDIPLIIVNRSSVYHLGSNVRNNDNYRRPLVTYDRRHSRPNAALSEQYTHDLIATACHFAAQRPVYLVRPIPEMTVDVPRIMARRHLLNRAGEVRFNRDEYDRRHAAVWQAQDQAVQQCGVQILDPTQALCDEAYCYGSDNGRPLYYDDDHLSEFGAVKGTEGFTRKSLRPL